ncbi:MAG TPA: ferrochelatase [Rhizomicrobium sp.]|nr:ferrochelatase [Rhizomicrobium sp.]
MKLAVVLFNLGGPDSEDAVEPFLRNLFTDPAILPLPGFVRQALGGFIARRRAPLTRRIYARIGGRSPILEETEAQARALEQALALRGLTARAFIAMRCWNPSSDDAARSLKAWGAERIVLLPLYPQFSTTTTASSLADWARAARKAQISAPGAIVCCYPTAKGFVVALVQSIRQTMAKMDPGLSYRLLLSAHGLPERVIRRGDPYQWQVEQTARAVVEELGIADLDWTVCYQSRVGPLKWIGPATDAEIRRAGAEGLGVIVAPIAFVSEHSETLVELDMDYCELARNSGVPQYLRAPVVGVRETFIEALAELVAGARPSGPVRGGALCPQAFRCGFREASP